MKNTSARKSPVPPACLFRDENADLVSVVPPPPVRVDFESFSVWISDVFGRFRSGCSRLGSRQVWTGSERRRTIREQTPFVGSHGVSKPPWKTTSKKSKNTVWTVIRRERFVAETRVCRATWTVFGPETSKTKQNDRRYESREIVTSRTNKRRPSRDRN